MSENRTGPREDLAGRERRVIRAEGLRIERRAGEDAADEPHIVGHASVFDQWTTLYEGQTYTWREIVRTGAYANALAEGQDVRALFNHDPNFLLGRTKSGTLALAEDQVGLLSDCRAPTTQTIRDLVLEPIARGDMSGMSFAFLVRRGEKQTVTTTNGVTVIDRGGERITVREENDRIIEERELLDLDLYDVSPVTYPAYEQTDVALRSLGERREAEVRGKGVRRRTLMRMRLRLAEALISKG